MELFDFTSPLFEPVHFTDEADPDDLTHRLEVLEEALHVWVGYGLEIRRSPALAKRTEVHWRIPKRASRLPDVDDAWLRVELAPGARFGTGPVCLVMVTLSEAGLTAFLEKLKRVAAEDSILSWEALGAVAPFGARAHLWWFEGGRHDAFSVEVHEEGAWGQLQEQAAHWSEYGPSRGGTHLLVGFVVPPDEVVGLTPQEVTERLAARYTWCRMFLEELARRPRAPAPKFTSAPADDLELELLEGLLPQGASGVHVSLRRRKGMRGLLDWLRSACAVCAQRPAVDHAAFGFGAGSFGLCRTCRKRGAQPLAWLWSFAREHGLSERGYREHFGEVSSWWRGKYVGWEGVLESLAECGSKDG